MAAPRRVIEMLLCMSLLVTMNLWGAATMAQETQQYPETTTTTTSSSCSNVLLSLSPCLDYITGSASTPSSGCCSQLAYVVGSQPQCLCEVVNGGAASIAATLNINQTQALGLPNACRVQTPPISICSTATGSVSPPAGVYVPSIPNSPAAGIGSTIVSSTNGGVGGGSFQWNSSSTAKLPSLLLLLFFFATTLSLTFTFTTIT